MTTIDTAAEPDERSGDRLIEALHSVGSWITTTDHKRIGRLFIVVSLIVAVLVALVAVLLGFERIEPSALVFKTPVVNELLQAMRIGLALGLMAPLGIGLAIAVVPLQVGARSLAFARVALAGFYAWLAGMVLLVVGLLNDGAGGGGNPEMVALFLLGNALAIIGLVAAAGTVATTVLTTRAPGMSLRRIPLFSWAALVSSIGVVLALPVALGTITYLYVDLRYDGATLGGTDGVLPWLSWMFGLPFVLLLALPAVGVFSELVPVVFGKRQPIRGGVLVGLGLVGVAALAAVTQQQVFELAWSGADVDRFSSLVTFALFNLVPLLGLAIVFALALLAAKPPPKSAGPRRLPRVTGAFLFAFFGIGMVLVGALANAIYAIDSAGLQGTVFEEGSVVYLAYGALLGVLGGTAWWAPKLWGRRLPEPALFGLALLGVLGTVLASLPYIIAGFAGQPAGAQIFSYSGPMTLWNLLVMVGHGVVGLTVIGFLLLLASGRGIDAGDDPFDAQTIEWTTTSPAPGNNYPEVPHITSAEPLLDMKTAHLSSSPPSSGDAAS